jgi:hypothetical protein
MLNFIVGVIVSTYERVWTMKKIIKFKHRAELNFDSCVVMGRLNASFIKCFSWFGLWELKPYHIVIISTSKEATKLDDSEYEGAADKIKQDMQKQTKEIVGIHDKLRENVQDINDAQQQLDQMASDQFKVLGEEAEKIMKEFKTKYPA